MTETTTTETRKFTHAIMEGEWHLHAAGCRDLTSRRTAWGEGYDFLENFEGTFDEAVLDVIEDQILNYSWEEMAEWFEEDIEDAGKDWDTVTEADVIKFQTAALLGVTIFPCAKK